MSKPESDSDVERAVRRLRQDLYRQAYYSRVGDSFRWATSRRSGWISERAQHGAYDQLLRALPSVAVGNVLDLGCGDGALLRRLVANSARPLVPYGVDFLIESIEAARSVASPHHHHHFEVGDVIEFDPGRRRFVLVLTSLSYAPPGRRGEFASRCRRWVQPGGALVLYEYRGSPLFDSLGVLADHLELPVTERVMTGAMALLIWTRTGTARVR